MRLRPILPSILLHAIQNYRMEFKVFLLAGVVGTGVPYLASLLLIDSTQGNGFQYSQPAIGLLFAGIYLVFKAAAILFSIASQSGQVISFNLCSRAALGKLPGLIAVTFPCMMAFGLTALLM